MAFAAVASLLLALLVWTVEPGQLWLVAVTLPPLWVPVLAQPVHDGAGRTDQLAIAGLSIGLAVLFVLGLLVFLLAT